MTLQQSSHPEVTSSTASSSHLWEFVALAVSLSALAGSLYLTMGMKLKACPLCLYERTFIMALVGALLIGLMHRRDFKPGVLAVLSLPLAIGGLGVAAFHVFLELTLVLECPPAVAGLGSAPQQSLAACCLVAMLLGIATARPSVSTAWRLTAIGGVLLGGVFSLAAVKSAPPLPPQPTEPYSAPLDGCRPSFHPQQPAT